VRTFIVLSLVGCVSACSVENRGPAADTVASRTPPAATADSGHAKTPLPSTGTWTVTPGGIGQVAVGMSVDDLRRVAGEVTLPARGAAECTYVRPANAPPGVSVMLASGRVARIDVDSAGVASDAGVAVGDSASKVEAAYAGRVATLPHKYVSGGQYLTVKPISPGDSTLRIVVESEGGRITRFRSGRVPEVEFVERCG
jgi:hypothetical protein